MLFRSWEPLGSISKNNKPVSQNSTSKNSTTPHSDSGSGIINKIQNKEFDSKLKIVPTENKSKTPYINERVKMISGKSIKSAIGMPYIDADKNDRTYNRTDLKYDLKQKLIHWAILLSH